MKVIAIKPAFHNGARVRVGAELEVPSDFKASWAAPVKSAEATAAVKATKAAKPEPRALSQAGKEETKSFIQAHSEKADLA